MTPLAIFLTAIPDRFLAAGALAAFVGAEPLRL
jgi:hypothetical protein